MAVNNPPYLLHNPNTHVIPGFLGTPAGITTKSAPFMALMAPCPCSSSDLGPPDPVLGRKPVT